MSTLLGTIQQLTENALRRTMHSPSDVSPTSLPTLAVETVTRASKRYELPGSVTVYDPHGKPITTGVLNDISSGGLSFFAAIELHIPQFIRLQFQIKTISLRVQAMVLRRCGYKYAVQFVGLTQSQQKMIETQLQLASGVPEDRP